MTHYSIDHTPKPTLRYRHFGQIQPMAEHDRAFAERHQEQRTSLWDRLFRRAG